MMIRSFISDIAYYLPPHNISTEEVENMIQQHSSYTIPKWLIDTILWVENRYRAKKNVYSSTMSICAIQKLKKDIANVDLLIYASTTQDCIEPWTSSIIIGELWLCCLCFDIQNACNSMINALEVADSFICSWKYKKILIVWAETPSKAINFNHNDKESFRQSFSSFGMGDGAVAMIIEAQTWDNHWLLFSKSITNWSLRKESTILWGWSRHFDTLEHNFFIGNPTSLKDFFLIHWMPLIEQWCIYTWISIHEFEKVFIHQVWHESYLTIIDSLQVQEDKLIKTYQDFWNIWSCTVPLQMALSGFKKNKYYLILGLWAGASIACHIYRH